MLVPTFQGYLTSSVKVSISSTMSSENGMSATHTFGISTNTIPSSTETSLNRQLSQHQFLNPRILECQYLCQQLLNQNN